MAKILISWMALEHDFIKGKGSVNPDGPNSTVHKLFYNYDYHLLLTSSKNAMDDTKYQHLITHLRNTYKHKIEERAMGISDVINLEEICGKIFPVLLNLKSHDVDIFISPGTPTMQVAWYLANESLGIKTTLFQVRRAEHTETKKPQKIMVEMEKSSYTSALIIKQRNIDAPEINKQSLIPDTLKGTYKNAEKIAAADHIGVLITGDTGTGKELLARYIHEKSLRSNKVFIPINCSAMGESLLESRLFGYVKDAHNMAHNDKKGLFEEAEGGTIFLDEIGDISPYMQQSLLRVLQEKEIQRIGEAKIREVNVRIISATNKDLFTLCTENKFRWDLYYRLAVSEIQLPSLSEYPYKEKEQWFKYFWKRSMREFNKKEPKFNAALKKRFLEYSFPGNLREMENMIDGLIAEAEEEIEHLPKRVVKPSQENSMKLIDVENTHIKKVLEMFPDNKQQVCKVLGITINTLKAKIEKYHLLEA